MDVMSRLSPNIRMFQINKYSADFDEILYCGPTLKSAGKFNSRGPVQVQCIVYYTRIQIRFHDSFPKTACYSLRKIFMCLFLRRCY
jgi:hypothetical protein